MKMQLPTDRPRPAQPCYSTDSFYLKLPTALTKSLRNLARHRHISFFATLATALVVLLRRRIDHDEVTIGVRTFDRPPEQADRDRPGDAVLQLQVPESIVMERLLREVDSALVKAQASQAAESLPSMGERSKLPQVVIELHPAPAGTQVDSERLSRALRSAAAGTTSGELKLALYEVEKHLIGRIEYAKELYDRNTIERIAGSWKMLLKGMAKHSRRPIGHLGMLMETEREVVLHLNNATASDYPRWRLIHELFEEQVRQSPDAVAVVWRSQTLTYSDLNRRANELARYMRSRGVSPRDRVGILMERGVDMVVGILGVLKSEATYIPMDPGYPADRLAYFLEDASPSLVLTHSSMRSRLPPTRTSVIEVDAEWSAIGREDGHDAPRSELTSEDLAYIMYTSGSTGMPKGVMVRHRNVVNYATYAIQRFGIEEADGALIGTSMSFDLALTGFYPTLLCGRPVHICAEDEDLSKALMAGRNYAPVKLTPTHLSTLSLPEDEIDGRVRSLVIGGELLQGAALRWWRKHSPGTRIFNHYGPTETTIGCVVHEVIEDIDGPVPIGRPISNARIYILNAYGAPVPIGVVGEIYIGGDGVAAGYWNRPDLTEERFVPDPFSSEPNARMYKTGDLGRWRPDGDIEFLGRNDDQVKIRGFRIELGEIGARLAEHPHVREGVAIAREDTPGDKRLVAYVTPRDLERPTPEALRAHLKSVLPEYMLPTAFVVIERLPLTANGKLDRHALPIPGSDSYVKHEYEAPHGAIEEVVAAVWQELLGVDRVGRRDNFFELGGHSLLIVMMIERLREAGFALDAQSVYRYPTLKDLAHALGAVAAESFTAPPNLIPDGCRRITPDMLTLVSLEQAHIDEVVRAVPGGPANIQDIYPLAPLQEGILFHHLLHGSGGDPYVLPALIRLSSKERLSALIGAVQAVIDRHDVLRTAVLWENLPQPIQVVYRKASLPVEEISLRADLDALAQMHAFTALEHQRLDLTRAPLLRLTVARDPRGTQWYAILRVHHIISDHESTTRVLIEVMHILGQGDSVLPSPTPYRDHVAQVLAYERSRDDEAFFRSKLGDVDEPTAPFGLLDVRGDGSRVEEGREVLDPDLVRRIRLQARQAGVSTATLFHAAWALVVSATSARDDVVFGTLLLGRMRSVAGGRPVLGMFINTLPIRINVKGIAARELIESTQRELIELLSHEQATLAAAQSCSGVDDSAPLFSSLLNYVHSTIALDTEQRFLADGVEVLGRREWTNYPIAMSVEDRGETLVLIAQTDRSIEPLGMTAYLRTTVESLVEALEHATNAPVQSLQVLPPDERRRVVEELSGKPPKFLQGQSINGLFEQIARARPDAIAVTCGSRSYTYAELNRRANQLARHLSALGVQPGEHVVILMQRSFGQVAAQLAILKCGAVYVPVDPMLTVERQNFMIKNCGARHVLFGRSETTARADGALRWMDYSKAEQAAAGLQADDLPPQAAPQPAYVMYTSGSTGTPKGVLIPQSGVLGLATDNGFLDIRPDDCVAYCSNPMFDASTLEVWCTLLNGAHLLVVPQAVLLEPARLENELRSHGVTVLFLTTGLFTQYAGPLAGVFPKLRYLMTGGDVIDPEVMQRVLRESPPEHLLNLYGPTECTAVSTAFEIETIDAGAGSIPIGRPINNASIHILNPELTPVPIGAAGEIYIGGAGVALGYLNRADLTRERFVADPFGPGERRLYRTGDLGRWRADGTIEFVGRNDQQVKIRGFRVELGEIEARLKRHPAIDDAVVIAREDVPGQKRLVAYVTSSGDMPAAELLREYLGTELPEYMVPAAFVALASLPLTPSGKLDRRALPPPSADAYVSRRYEAPEGETEEAIAEIWKELLRVDQVGRQDRFFELGGHSLLAMQVAVRVRATFSIDVPVAELFDHPSLADFSSRVDARREEQLMERLADGGAEVDELLRAISSMPEHEVRRLMSELNRGVRQ